MRDVLKIAGAVVLLVLLVTYGQYMISVVKDLFARIF
jgi:hypothetical protein